MGCTGCPDKDSTFDFCNTFSFTSKFKHYKSRVTSILLYGCETWTLLADSEERIQAFKTKCLRNILCISYSETRPTTGCGIRSTSLWVHRNLFWQLSRDGNLHGSGMSHATTVSPKPSFGHFGGWATPWSAEEMLAGQDQRVDIPARPRTAHKGLRQKRLEEDLC